MLTLRAHGPSGDAIPSHLTTLSVSWLNGQFRALAVHRGVIEGAWDTSSEIESGQFEALVREAVAKTNYRGRTVSLLLAHPRMAHQLVELPPVKGQAIQKIVQRQAQQQKLFQGEAAWTSQSSLSGKGVQRVILHLLPRPFLDQLVQGCQRNGLDLVSVVPVSAVLHRQLTQLPHAHDKVLLLAAETGGSTTVVVGRGDGQLLLVRTLPSNWNGGMDRLSVDLNRTILFLNQQFSLKLTEGMWVFGAGAREQAQTFQAAIQLPVSISPLEYQPAYWATDALKLRPGFNPNFLGPELQKAPQRRAYAKVVAAAAAVLAFAAIVISIFAFRMSSRESANSEQMRQRAAQLEKQRDQLQQRNAELDGQQQVISLLGERQSSPIPAWFLGYLSEAVPSDLVVTNLDLRRGENGAWRARLALASQGAAKKGSMAQLSKSAASLREKLSSGPFHMAPVGGGPNEPPGRTPPQPGQVVIEGILR